jgi:DNA-binding transcriptional ArsR family regulator
MEAMAALADPTRRRIVELLAERDRSTGEIAEEFDISRPGVSKHLRVLREHGLVRTRVAAQQRIYSLEPTPLEELEAWLARYRVFWTNRLDALETQIVRARRQRRTVE